MPLCDHDLCNCVCHADGGIETSPHSRLEEQPLVRKQGQHIIYKELILAANLLANKIEWFRRTGSVD